MTGRREFLFLAHRIPYPPDKGDKIRTYRFLRHLAQRFDVHLAAFVDDPADFAHRGTLAEICASVALVPLNPGAARVRSALSLARGEPLTFGYYRDSRMRRAVAALRARSLAGEYAFSSSMAPYLEPAVAGRPRIADICDADSEKWREYAADASFPLRSVYAREHRRLAAAETRIINRFDLALAISAAEADVLGSRAGVARAIVAVGNGVDAAYFAPTHAPARPPNAADVVFVGAMDYKPNVDAALWFVREVWPLVRAARARATFAIVGAKPTPEIAALNGADGVAVTGRVADVRPYLHHARLVVAPLTIARGVQNKVLEAMAAGKALVATAAANLGIDAAPGAEILIEEDARGFAAAVGRLLGDEALARSLGAAARVRALRDFSWERRLCELDAALDRAGVGGT